MYGRTYDTKIWIKESNGKDFKNIKNTVKSDGINYQLLTALQFYIILEK